MMTYDDLRQLVLREVNETLHAVSPVALDDFRKHVMSARRIFTAGKGRSGLCMRAFAMRLMHLGLTAHVVDEATTPAIGAADLLVLGSGSGRTPTLLNYAAKTKSVGGKIALVTATTDSPLVTYADVVLHLPAPSVKIEGTDTSKMTQPMANRFEQCQWLVLDMVTIQLMQQMGTDGTQMFTRHANLE
jgi:6-phospho-3-hexuloisomerase